MGIGTSAARGLQNRIEATQALDALTYGIRSIELCRSVHGASAAHVAQIEAAQAVADWRLSYYGRAIGGTHGYASMRWENEHGALRRLKAAKKLVAADLAAIKATLGGVRQLRLAIAAEAGDELAARRQAKAGLELARAA